MHVSSIGHERQLVASLAFGGFRDFLKKERRPVDETKLGRCGGSLDDVEVEQSSQRTRSMSWHDFVSKDGAVVDSFRHLPLRSVSLATWHKAATYRT